MNLSPSLSCVWRTPALGTGVVVLAGDLDYDSADQLLEVVSGELATNTRWLDVRVDCTALGHCDSYGLSVLLMLRRLVGEAGARLYLDNRGPRLERMLMLTDTLTHLTGERR